MGNSQKKSNGVLNYPSGNVYTGEMKGKKRHGKGKYEWTDGAVYIGDFENNMQHGQGRMVFPNGNVYEGGFYRNNINGMGKLTTTLGEEIDGKWTFKGRADNVPAAHSMPVGTYDLNVVVIDRKSQVKQPYGGPATVHLASGLVVLPGMASPKDSVFQCVMAIPVEGGNNVPSFHAVTAEPIEPVQSEKGEEFGQVIQPGTVSEVAQAIPVLDSSMANQQQGSGISYGVHDMALDPKPKKNGKGDINLLDPRNYF